MRGTIARAIEDGVAAAQGGRLDKVELGEDPLEALRKFARLMWAGDRTVTRAIAHPSAIARLLKATGADVMSFDDVHVESDPFCPPSLLMAWSIDKI